MKITSVKLDTIAVRESQYPDSSKDEFLLVGRSNVGKSSFINTLINRKDLARTSEKPGKTRTINFYLINDAFYLVDVPGYGYAQTSMEQRKKFGLMIEEYIMKRQNLKRVFLLIDFRIKPTENDLLMYNFLKYYKIPTTIVFTKADKIGSTKRNQQLQMLKKAFDIVVGDNIVLFSSVSKVGKEEILNYIERLMEREND